LGIPGCLCLSGKTECFIPSSVNESQAGRRRDQLEKGQGLEAKAEGKELPAMRGEETAP
jgi:hypothetical protein